MPKPFANPSPTAPVAPNPMTRQRLLSFARPYANGAIHLGHLAESMQTHIRLHFRKRCAQQPVRLSLGSRPVLAGLLATDDPTALVAA